MAIVDVMGPVMTGPSSLYSAGVVKIGYLARHVYSRLIRKVRFVESISETVTIEGLRALLRVDTQ